MIDARLTIDLDNRFDFSIEDGDIAGVNGFDTAIWVSLFTDARATESQVLLPQYRRGWPGNLVSTVPDRQLGGLLWLIDQRRLNQATLNAAVDYARGSLSWLVEDNLALDVNVTGEIVPVSGIRLTIIITAPNGSTASHYVNLWEMTGAY